MADEDDRIFWERLAEMPFEEHEQECVLRRERLVLARAMLIGEKRAALERGDKGEAQDIHVATEGVNCQLSLINERIKYLRRLIDVISWKNVIKTRLGEDVYQELLAWRIQEEQRSMPFEIPGVVQE